jgi:hypothetical protein
MKTKIIFSISILGLLLCTNTVSADNFISNWYNTNITGRIEVPIQQGCSGTCWLLSAVSGLNETEVGKTVISDTVKSDDNGGAVVTFKGLPNSPINVSADELARFDSLNSTNKLTFSTGDADMRAIEIAAKKVYESGNFDSRLADDVLVGREDSDLLLTFELLTGSDQTSWQYATSWLGSFFLPDNVTRLRNSDIDNFKNDDQYSTVCFTSDDIYATDRKNDLPLKLIGENKHLYTILSSDDKSVYLLDSIYGDKFEMTRDDFLDALPTVFTQKLDLTMTSPEGDNLSYLNEIDINYDYALTDVDYQEIVDGYNFYEDFDIEGDIDYDRETKDGDSQGVVGGSDYDEDSDVENNVDYDFLYKDNQETADDSQELIHTTQKNDEKIILCGETYKDYEDFVVRYDPGHVYGDKIEKITQEIGEIMVEEGLLHEKINHGTDGYSGLGTKCNNSCSVKYCLDGCTEDYYSCVETNCTPLYKALEPFRIEYDKFLNDNKRSCRTPEGVSLNLEYYDKLHELIEVAKNKTGEYEI